MAPIPSPVLVMESVPALWDAAPFPGGAGTPVWGLGIGSCLAHPCLFVAALPVNTQVPSLPHVACCSLFCSQAGRQVLLHTAPFLGEIQECSSGL